MPRVSPPALHGSFLASHTATENNNKKRGVKHICYLIDWALSKSGFKKCAMVEARAEFLMNTEYCWIAFRSVNDWMVVYLMERLLHDAFLLKDKNLLIDSVFQCKEPHL